MASHSTPSVSRRKTMIEITRGTPPVIGCCRSRRCEAQIEWVRTVKANRAMPINVPAVLHIDTLPDGTQRIFVDDASVHWATCPDAKAFKRRAVR